VNEELVRLNHQPAPRPAQTAGPAASAPAPAAVSANGTARHVNPPPAAAQTNGEAHQGDDEDVPQNGSQLLGWARKQEEDCKSWIIRYGKKLGFEGRVVEWNTDPVGGAFWACKKALRNR
jgi:hypothetical protein